VVFTIGNTRVLDLFGVRLRLLPSPVHVTGEAAVAGGFSAETFTHWVHAGCTTHLFQTFLRRLVTLATRERASPIAGTMMFLCKIIKKSGWVSWRCATCAALVEVIREDILVPGMEEQDPYGLRQKSSGGEASAPLSTEEWVRLLACNGRLAVGDPAPVLVAGGEARKVWVRAALAVQGETRKILEHTTQTKMRADFLDALAEAVAKEASTAPEEDRQKWIQDASSRLRAVIQQWLVTNFRFIPFSEIDFDRLSTALLIFRTAFFSDSTRNPQPPREEDGLETVEGLFQMSTLLLEPHDRSLCLCVYEKEEWKKELAVCRDYHPMHRRQQNVVV
jgi:hypothetical protein